jgi:hypothetical protein
MIFRNILKSLLSGNSREMDNITTQGQTALLESFSPVACEYGSDLRDKKWKYLNDAGVLLLRKRNKPMIGEMFFTYMTYNESVYQIYLLKRGNTFEVGFGRTQTYKADTFDDIEYISRYHRHYLPKQNAYAVFNRVFYVILQGLQEVHATQVAFRSEDELLGNLYDKLVKQKSFINILSRHGYSFVDKHNGFYLFRRQHEN